VTLLIIDDNGYLVGEIFNPKFAADILKLLGEPL